MNNTERWSHFGYPSKEPCVVCGKVGECKSEPRFGYTVCKDHCHIPPTDISKYVEK